MHMYVWSGQFSHSQKTTRLYMSISILIVERTKCCNEFVTKMQRNSRLNTTCVSQSHLIPPKGSKMKNKSVYAVVDLYVGVLS